MGMKYRLTSYGSQAVRNNYRKHSERLRRSVAKYLRRKGLTGSQLGDCVDASLSDAHLAIVELCTDYPGTVIRLTWNHWSKAGYRAAARRFADYEHASQCRRRARDCEPIESDPSNGESAVCLAGSLSESNPLVALLLSKCKSDQQRTTILALANNPAATQTELSKALGIDRAAVKQRLRRLRATL